jgi:hypothetical protein
MKKTVLPILIVPSLVWLALSPGGTTGRFPISIASLIETQMDRISFAVRMSAASYLDG